MAYLVDTNILLRVARRNDPNYSLVRAALRTLRRRGETLCYTSQNLVEYWNVSTRPSAARGGLGLTLPETDRRARLLVEQFFQLLPDSPLVHTQWRQIVVAHGVAGVQVHDARLVAFLRVYGIPQLLTLNTADFARYPAISSIRRIGEFSRPTASAPGPTSTSAKRCLPAKPR